MNKHVIIEHDETGRYGCRAMVEVPADWAGQPHVKSATIAMGPAIVGYGADPMAAMGSLYRQLGEAALSRLWQDDDAR